MKATTKTVSTESPKRIFLFIWDPTLCHRSVKFSATTFRKELDGSSFLFCFNTYFPVILYLGHLHWVLLIFCLHSISRKASNLRSCTSFQSCDSFHFPVVMPREFTYTCDRIPFLQVQLQVWWTDLNHWDYHLKMKERILGQVKFLSYNVILQSVTALNV